MEKDISQLTPNPKNPRKISDPKLKQLEKTLREFGSLDGIIFNKTTGRLIGGHQRQKVFKHGKITVDETGHGFCEWNGERWPYREVEWDQNKEMAANIAANKGGGEWDFTYLSEWFLELDAQNYDLDLTMFDASEIEDIIVGKEEPESGEGEGIEPLVFERDGEGNTCQLINADCLDALKKLPDNSIDSIVTDPPAGISFMGKEWDDDKGGRKQWIHWLTQVMQECRRVLKPGGHAFVWSIPKTSHWTGNALEDAGFEVRDCVYHLFGSGFPKSLDVSKAIDKEAGATRKVIGKRKDIHSHGKNSRKTDVNYTTSDNFAITAPASAASAAWDGFGTALKPAAECWWLVRKPISEKTIAQNVLKWGTGAINIDGCRIGNEQRQNQQKDVTAWAGNNWGGAPQKNSGEIKTVSGRFPANLMLSHHPDCRETGESTTIGQGKPVNGKDVKRTKSSTRAQNYRKPERTSTSSFGAESVPVWECVEDCPVRMLDEQSGEIGPSRFFYVAKPANSEKHAGLDGVELVWEKEVWEKPDLNLLVENINSLARDISVGTLTENFEWSTDIFGSNNSEKYPSDLMFTIGTTIRLITALGTSSSSLNLSTRDIIRGAIETIEMNGLSLAASVEFLNHLKPSITKESTGDLLGAVVVVLKTLLQIKGYANPGNRNFHATIKPANLMRYLCRMITPPGGTILDTFTGSGTTGIGALAEGFNFIGIEKDPAFVDIATRRILSAFPKVTSR